MIIHIHIVHIQYSLLPIFDSKCEVPHSEAIASMMLLRADKHYSMKGK